MTDTLKTAIRREGGFGVRILISLAASPNHSPRRISAEI
jgi:hypothetical protein